jgi:hypothetical protein
MLGAGITRVTCPVFPANLGLTLAMMLTLEPTEADDKHKLRAVLQDQDGNQIARIDGEFGVQPGKSARPGERLAVPMVLPLAGLPIPKAGTYSFELLLDSQHVRSLAFVAQVPTPPILG